MKRIGIALGILVLAVIAWSLARNRPVGDVPLLSTSAWGSDGSLMLRTSSQGRSRCLLLRHLSPEESIARRYPVSSAQDGPPIQLLNVYQYVPETRVIEPTDVALWHSASDESDCDTQRSLATEPFLLNSQHSKLYYKGNPVSTAGETVLWIGASPNSAVIAVLSATGRRTDSVVPFLGVGGASGQHYHEVFQADDGKRIGSAIRLPLSSKDVTVMGCWSGDGYFVVYYDILYRHTCVVDVLSVPSTPTE